MPDEYNLQDVMGALKAADEAGATADAERLAQLADRLMKAQPEEEAKPKSYMAKGFAAALGAPTDIVSSGLRAIGLVSPEAEPPFGGSKSIESGLRAVGINVPEEPPQTAGEFARHGVGEVAGMFVPGMGATKIISRGTGLAATLAKQIYKTMIKHPAATMAAEISGGAGMGVGRKIGEEHPSVGGLAELAGGVVGGTAPSMLAYTPTRLGMKVGKWGLEKISSPLSKEGATYRAGDFLKQQVTDPDAAAKAIREGSISNLPPVAMTNEKRLMALYNHIKVLDPVKDAAAIEQASRAAMKLAQEMKALGGKGSPEILRELTEKRIASIELSMDNRIAKRMEAAQKKLDALPIAQRQSQESIVVRNELTKVMQQERQLVQEAWDAVPKRATVGVENTKKAFADIITDLPTAQKGDIPVVLKNHIALSDKTTSTTINELQGLRSKLLEVSRQARSQSKWNKARIADDVSDAILEDMTKAADVATPEGELLNTALAATRKFKQRFEQGTVGRILGYDRTSAPTIAPELTLDIAMSKKGVIDIDKVVITPEAKAATERYMARSFTDYAVDANGAVNPVKANKWIKNNEELLDNFPDLQNRLSNVSEAQRLALETKATMEARKAALRDPKISAASQFLKADVGDEIKNIMKSPNAMAMTNQLVKQTRKDATGQSLEGLRGGFVEYILDKSAMGTFNDMGEKTLSGKALLGFVDDNIGTLRQVFTSDKINRMKRIGWELSKLETLEKTKGMAIDYSDTVSNVLRFASRFGGAAAGRHWSRALGVGGTVQIPGFFAESWHKIVSKMTKNRFEQLVQDAVLSPDGKLLETLLMPIDKPAGSKQAKEINTRLNAWLAASGSRVLQDITREDERGEQNE